MGHATGSYLMWCSSNIGGTKPLTTQFHKINMVNIHIRCENQSYAIAVQNTSACTCVPRGGRILHELHGQRKLAGNSALQKLITACMIMHWAKLAWSLSKTRQIRRKPSSLVCVFNWFRNAIKWAFDHIPETSTCTENKSSAILLSFVHGSAFVHYS